MRDRSQAVHVNSNESASTVLKFRVPQGSVLGPKIFIDYAEDVSEIFSQNALSQHLFADDMQCLCCDKPAEVPYMVTRIENCVAHVCTWCAEKRLQLNADKTEILWFGSAANLRKLSADELNIRVGQSVVKPVTTVRNLGVLIDTELSMRDHVSRLAQTCFFTYAVYAQCVVSSVKTSRNNWFVLSYCHDSTTVT